MAKRVKSSPPSQCDVPLDDGTLRALIEGTEQPIALIGANGRVLVWNRGLAEISGMSAPDCVGRPATQILIALGLPDAVGLLASVTQAPEALTDRLTIPSGGNDASRTYDATLCCTRDAKDRPAGVVLTLRDVTAQVEHERDLTESERIHRNRFMHAADALLVIDPPSGRYIDANLAACKLTGYTREELLRMHVPQLSLPEERTAASKRYGNLVATGVSRAERIIERKDGSHLYVEAHAVSLGDGTIQTSVRDVSVRKAAEEKLHQLAQRLQFYFERLPLGFVVWSPQLCVAEWNPAAERIFGWTPADIVGKSWTEMVSPKSRAEAKKVVEAALAGDTASHSIHENMTRDGRVITCEWFNAPLRDSAGKVIGLASMVQDVTARELAEAQLRHAQKMESLGVLTSGIAHDFGNLLMVVLGNVTLLGNMKDLPERTREHIELITEAGTKASQLTSHLLAFARTGRHNPEMADLNKIVNGALKLVRASVSSNLKINVDLEADIPRIRIDQSQTEQIIMNLCLNAAEATPDGGKLSIRTRRTYLRPEDLTRCLPPEYSRAGPKVELIVSDTGHGMDADTLNRIFDPFFSTKIEGHGLGLAAVLGILKQHEAHVWTESAPGNGTTFHVYFVAPEPEASQQDGQSSADQAISPGPESPPTSTSKTRKKKTTRKQADKQRSPAKTEGAPNRTDRRAAG